MLWIAGGTLTALTTIALMAPAFSQRTNIQFRGRAQAVYADQLAEVARDETLGLISSAEAVAARTEIKRRMLGAARNGTAETNAPPRRRAGRVLLVAALLVPALGAGTYLLRGNPFVPSMPYADRAAERAQAAKMEDLIATLRLRLEANPNSPTDGWILLAQSYMRMSRPDDAVKVYQKLIARGDTKKMPEINVLYAEAQITSDNGIVTPKAEAAIDRTLAARPGNVAAIYYKARALEQSGELNKAFALLRDRINAEKSRQPWMAAFAARANFLADKIKVSPVTLPPAPPAGKPAPTNG